MRSARNASSAQYCRKTFTVLPSAAAPAVRTAAAWSRSSVPEKRTRLSGWSISSPRRRRSALIGRYRGHPAKTGQSTLEDRAHEPTRDHHVRVAQAVPHLATVPFGIDDPGRTEHGEVLGDIRLRRADAGGQA